MAENNIFPKPPKLPKIEILELTPLQDAGSLRAFFTVRIAGKFTINKMRLVQQDGQAAWISGPQETWRDVSGKRRYTTLLELHERDWRDALTEAVLAFQRAQADGEKIADGAAQEGGRR